MQIDPDISAADARRLLSVREDDSPLTMDRRRFLQMVGYGVGAGAVLGGLGEVLLPELMSDRMREAYAASPIGAADGVIVLVGFDGGLDGLNTVVPYTNSTYYQQHGGLSIPANQVLQLNGSVGLNPNLSFLKWLYDRGEVAVVQGVGYPNPDLSHFTSMAL
ncbi:MAG TPA: twin-arginine translocation signal domain-containing protein, partial [Ilumatobacteraceae bacterium]|nr:twin-arginine translocation signal domain-containing protein [Ilumatobacteraceae bacterium]